MMGGKSGARVMAAAARQGIRELVERITGSGR